MTAYKRDLTAPVLFEEKPRSKKGRPAALRGRAIIASLDTPMPRIDTLQTYQLYEENLQAAYDALIAHNSVSDLNSA